MHLRTLLAVAILSTLFLNVEAQNTAPYWSLAGNSNATSASKVGTTNAIPLNLTTNNITWLRIATDGKVGINTTAPLKQFHVNGFGAFGNRVTVGNSNRALNLADDNAVMRILRVHPTNAPAVELISRTSADGPNIAYWDFYVQPSDASFRIRDRIGGGSGVDRLTLSNTGNVGIGMISPRYRLTIRDSTETAVVNVTNVYRSELLTYPAIPTTALYGRSVNAFEHPTGRVTDEFGFGVLGEGGDVGVRGYARLGTLKPDYSPFDDAATGVEGSAEGVNSTAYISTITGVSGTAEGGYNVYGIYGAASGSDFTAAGYFAGDVYATNYYSTSDRKFKKKIAPIKNATELIMKLKPSTYQFKTDEYKSMHLTKGQQMGLVADEVKQILPQLVHKAVKPAEYDAKDRRKVISPKVEYEAVDYQGLIPILVASMQEFSKKNDALVNENKDLKERLDRIENLLLNGNAGLSPSSAYLESPFPNPAQGNTIVRYGLPDGSTSGRLTFTNASGQVLREVNLSGRRTGQVNLNTASLPSGVYTYTLYVDGRQAASKQLVIAR